MVRNSTKQWGWLSKLFHWIAAVLILLLLGHGWWMTHMTPRPERLANYAGHSAIGYDLLMLTVLRLLWRWLNPVPVLPTDLKPWERMAAQGGHFLLYLLMLVVSVTGPRWWRDLVRNGVAGLMSRVLSPAMSPE